MFSPLVVSYSLPEQAAVTATEAPPSDVLAARTGTTVASTYLVQSSLIQNLGGDGLTFVTVKDYLADTLSRSGSVNLPLIDVAEAEHPPEGQDGKTEGVAELTMGRNLVVFEGGSFVIEEELAQVTTMLVRNKVLGRLSVQMPAGDRFEFRVLNASPSVEADDMSVHAALDVTVSFMEAQGASAEGKLSPSSEAGAGCGGRCGGYVEGTHPRLSSPLPRDGRGLSAPGRSGVPQSGISPPEGVP